jgi:hypothetical protein
VPLPLQWQLLLPWCHCHCNSIALLPHCPCPIAIAITMSSNQKKRGSSPGTPHDKTPSKRSKTGSSSGGRPSKASNFVAVENVALCKAYVNVTLNPINGVGQKSKEFWDHVHRKYCLFLKDDNPSEALPEQDSVSLKNQFQRQIQKKMNVYNKYYKQVKECPVPK